MNQIARATEPRPTYLSVTDQEALAKLAFLRAVSARTGPALVPYATHRRFLDDTKTFYFMALDERHQYVPQSITRDELRDAARVLYPNSGIEFRDRHMLALGRLYALTVGPRRTPEERDFLLNSYLSKTLYYPTDVVEYVLDAMAASSKFFPPWSDVQAQLNALCGWRGAAQHALSAISDKLTH
jgi:hypothetical protein